MKKNSFGWNDDTEVVFNRLKLAMISAPLLALPNFSEEFVIETDASDYGVGEVLLQAGKPIAFMNKALSGQNLLLSIYEKEMLAVVMAVQK